MERHGAAMLRRALGVLERWRDAGRIVRWSAGASRRFAVVASGADPQHAWLVLDAIETYYPGAAVWLVFDRPSRWTEPSPEAPYPGLASCRILASAAGDAVPAVDCLLLLHPYPYATAETLASLPQLRALARGIRARERWRCFRHLEVWRDAAASRIWRRLLDWGMAPLARRAAAWECGVIGKYVAPVLAACGERPLAQPCSHGRKFRVFEYPRPLDFCPDCGMGISLPDRARDSRWLEQTYGASYALHERFTGWREWQAHCREQCRRLGEVFRLLGFDPAEAPRPAAGRRVLDLGCGYGRYVPLWAGNGWRYLGVDPSVHNIEFARRDVPHWIEPGWPVPEFIEGEDTDERVAAGGPYDLIVLCHVLEHVPDPLVLLRRLHALAAPGGRLFIEVPHAALYTWNSAQNGRLNAEHLWDFTPAMLRALAREAGWGVRGVITNPDPEHYPHLALLAERM
jgi:2-polyprenyl-3-methyl-5-hydroxy-6-metoxy-1,4-benzoquinol methylase